MADESVHVHIRITSDKREIAATRRELERLSASARAANADFGDLNDTLEEHERRHRRIQRNSTSTNRSLDSNGSSADRLGKRLRKTGRDMDFLDKTRQALSTGLKTGLKFALIGATIEMVALGAAIASVNGLMAIGSATVKTYRFLMHGLAYAAAAGVAALATIAAAQREYNAALQAFRYNSMPALGAGVNQSTAALRMLTSDSRVAVFGMQNLNAAFASISKNAQLTKPLQDALAGIGDFAVAAGGDIGKNFAQAAEFVGLLKKEGKLTTEVMAAATKIGPEFEKALKESGKTGADEILALMSSGTLAKSAGVEGALSAVNNTLMGQAKAFFTEMQSNFADLGQIFLPGVKRSFEQIQRIVRVTFMRISGEVAGFGATKLLDDIVKVTDRLADLFVNLFDKYLPKSQKLFGGVGQILKDMQAWWYRFVNGLKSLSEAGRVLTDTFGPVFGQIFSGLGDSMRLFARIIVENREKFLDFGDALVAAFRGIQDFFNGFKQVVVANLPLISSVVRGLGEALGFLGRMLGNLSERGPFGALLSLAGMVGLFIGAGKIAPNSRMGRMGGAIGSRIGMGGGGVGGAGAAMTRSATINASVVYLNTRSTMGPTGPIPGGGPGGGGKGPTGGPAPTRMQRMGSAARGAAPFAGSMAGIAALGSFAGEEASPFIAGGAMLSMINPYAGLAVAGLGTAATAKSAGGGALAGLAGGAAAGAGIGTLLGGPVIGTAIGAGLGAAFGATMGYFNDQAAQRDESRAVARERVQGTFGVGFGRELFGPGGPEGARKMIERAAKENDRAQTVFRKFQETEASFGNAITDLGRTTDVDNKRVVERMKEQGIQLTQAEEDLLKNQAHLSSYFSSMQKQTEGLIALGEGPLSHFENQTGNLAAITGKTNKEITDLALAMGVDLLDPTRSLTQNLKELGLATVRTANQIAGANREIYVKRGENIFGASKRFEEAQFAIDQAAEAIRQTGKSTTAGQARDFVQTFYEQALLMADGDPTSAMRYIQEGFLGRDGNLTGTAFTTKGSPLYGQEEVFRQLLAGDKEGRTIQEALLEAINQNLTEMNAKTGSDVLSAITVSGLQVAGGPEATAALNAAIQSRIASLQATAQAGGAAGLEAQTTIQELIGLGEAITTGAPAFRNADGTVMTGENLAGAIENYLAGRGVRPTEGGFFDIMNQPGVGEALKGNAKEMHDAIMNAAKEGIGKTPTWLAEAPTWYNQPQWWSSKPQWYESGVGFPPDTKTPRAFGDTLSSTLGRTMARHSYFDGGLPGKRTVTSGYRNFALGSLKSDHLTGNAYDLTGQNLVGYANLVNSSGGFAEFHGSGLDRHLHVVPGATPIGDSVTSMTPMVGVSSGGGTFSYTINVYPSAGQDAAMIAQEVMNRIEAKEKSVRERS